MTLVGGYLLVGVHGRDSDKENNKENNVKEGGCFPRGYKHKEHIGRRNGFCQEEEEEAAGKRTRRRGQPAEQVESADWGE